MAPKVKLRVGDIAIAGVMEHERSPQSCALFLEKLPYYGDLLHVRWSGEGVYMPFREPGLSELDQRGERRIHHPTPGEVILYPGPESPGEVLISYGGVAFASAYGSLAGAHIITLECDREVLEELGRRALWDGAQKVGFELM